MVHVCHHIHSLHSFLLLICKSLVTILYVCLLQLDLLKTPDSKSVPDGFVACRSRYSQDVEFSPIPENLDNIAEEDLWTRLNKGCVTDLDMLEMTPNLKRESSFLQEKSSVSFSLFLHHLPLSVSLQIF